MEQTETMTAGPSPTPGGPPHELVRPLNGRMIAGVAKGLANRYGMPDWLPRLVFALTTFVGGLGVALYLAGWGLIRSEDETEPVAARFFSKAGSKRSWLGIGLIFIAALILLENFTFLSGGVIWAGAIFVVGVLLYMGYVPVPGNQTQDKEVREMTTTIDAGAPSTELPVVPDTPGGAGLPPVRPTPTPPILPPAAAKPKEQSMLGRITMGFALVALGVLAILDRVAGIPIDADPRHYLALGVAIIGVGLLVGSVWGHARWLILVGVVLVPTLLFSPVFEVDWNSEEFDVVEAPTTFGEVEDIYTASIGTMVIDLTELPWSGEEVEIVVQMDSGDLRIVVPDEVGITGSASVSVGRVGASGRESAGLGEPSLQFAETGPLGTVLLDATVKFGNIEIVSD